jgi:hypothetical protein
MGAPYDLCRRLRGENRNAVATDVEGLIDPGGALSFPESNSSGVKARMWELIRDALGKCKV